MLGGPLIAWLWFGFFCWWPFGLLPWQEWRADNDLPVTGPVFLTYTSGKKSVEMPEMLLCRLLREKLLVLMCSIVVQDYLSLLAHNRFPWLPQLLTENVLTIENAFKITKLCTCLLISSACTPYIALKENMQASLISSREHCSSASNPS